MAKTADTDNANAVTRLDAMSDHWREDSHASTQQGRSFDVGNVVRKLVKVCFGPHREIGKRALVQIRGGVLAWCYFAVVEVALLTMLTLAAAALDIAEANTVTTDLVSLDLSRTPYVRRTL